MMACFSASADLVRHVARQRDQGGEAGSTPPAVAMPKAARRLSRALRLRG